MKNNIIMSLVLMAGQYGFAGGHDPRVIMSLIKGVKVSLLQGIDLAEKRSGPVTSAKFEVGDNGKLDLSIYTVPEGLSVEPEKATLSELAGDPTALPFEFNGVVFSDKEHIARASVHMTLFQLSRYSIEEVIGLALKRVRGTPIDVRNPMMRNKRPVADVIVGETPDEIYSVTVDLLSGKTEVKKTE